MEATLTIGDLVLAPVSLLGAHFLASKGWKVEFGDEMARPSRELHTDHAYGSTAVYPLY